MRRYLAIGAGALVLVAVLWGMVWWSGRSDVERAVDEAVAGLRDRGWDVVWDSRTIAGFPFGYVVHLGEISATQAATGTTIRLPWTAAETQGRDSIVLRMPDSFSVEMPAQGVAGPAAGAEPDTLQRLTATAEADALVIVLAQDGTVELTADRLSWAWEDPSSGATVGQSIEALEATSVPEPPGGRYRAQAAALDMEASLQGGEGTGSTVSAAMRDLALEGSATVPSPGALAEMLYAGAPGQAVGSLTAGSIEMRVVSTAEAPGTLDWRAEGLSGNATLTSGRMELQGESRGNAWSLSSPAMPLQGTLTAPLAQATYAVPMAPSGRPDEMAIRLLIQDVAADEALWATLDPGGTLPRDPATLLVDVTGTMRVTERIDRLRPGAEPPFEVSTLNLRELSASALGAAANATGQIEILQPVGVPLGEIQVGATGLGTLIGTLGRAGILSPELVTMAEAIMQVYLRPAAGRDVWTAEVAFTRQGTLVNGLPVH